MSCKRREKVIQAQGYRGDIGGTGTEAEGMQPQPKNTEDCLEPPELRMDKEVFFP